MSGVDPRERLVAVHLALAAAYQAQIDGDVEREIAALGQVIEQFEEELALAVDGQQMLGEILNTLARWTPTHSTAALLRARGFAIVQRIAWTSGTNAVPH